MTLHTGTIKAVINNYKYAEKTSKMANSLLPHNVTIPAFYNPGRPVIISVVCNTSRISGFVDHYIQPAVKTFNHM